MSVGGGGIELQGSVRPYLIYCGILKEEIERLMERGSLPVEPYFLDAGLHADYGDLEKGLTRAIGKCSRDGTRGVVVVYGDLCHPNMKGLIGKYDNVVKVDALNCIDCLLGGHGRLLEIDPNHEYFYLSPGWMPSRLKANARFRSIFEKSEEEMRRQFSRLRGIILFDSLGNLEGFEEEVEDFSRRTGLPVLESRVVGLDGLEGLILEAIKRLEQVRGAKSR
ncbi:MAG: DUF1638 domain-containing protein [Candidatus Verstraetearchaeota archaeon]|nr:DUF1638 domain-containing protein [Candidatus Verstraetearchaeota archaeon]